ncbi:MAG: chromate transporter [Lachnospiraceae bacterium]
MKKIDVRKGIEIFFFFFQIGCFTFGGGWSILTQIEQEFVERRKWITREELMDLTAVGRSLPGIMITNISMLFGYTVNGWFGGICAIVGIVCPAIIILSVVTICYDLLKENPYCYAALKGIGCAVVPIMAKVVISLGKDALKTKIGPIVFIAAFLILFFLDVGNIVLICAGIIVAMIWWIGEKIW